VSEQRLNVLIIEDNPGDVYLIRKMLTAIAPSAFTLETADRLAQGLARLAVPGVDVVLLDLSLPDSCGLEMFTQARAQAPQIPIVVLSGSDDESLAIQAVHAGAQDYLVKGQVDHNLLARALRYAVERGRVEQERADLLAREQAARAETEAAVYARDELLAFVAHDLKNPLATIEGYSQLLSQRIGHLGLPESARLVADLRKIEAAAKQMTVLIDELLDFNRLQAGLPLDLDRYPIDLVTLVRHLVAEKQQAALHHQFTLEVAVPELIGS
jgi:DNA-binding NarL/FixJ family response regulator